MLFTIKPPIHPPSVFELSNNFAILGENFKSVSRPSSFCSQLLDFSSLSALGHAVMKNFLLHLASLLERTWRMVMP